MLGLVAGAGAGGVVLECEGEVAEVGTEGETDGEAEADAEVGREFPLTIIGLDGDGLERVSNMEL